jgi:hypothetical protein
LDSPEVSFSIVPGEKFNSSRGPTFKDFELQAARTQELKTSVAASGFVRHPERPARR